MSFAIVIKELRESMNLNQEEFANKLNNYAEKSDGLYSSSFNKTNISKWENAKAEPRMDTVRLISETFIISPNLLLEIDNEDREVSNNKNIKILAAHIDDDVTEDQMDDILKYISFIKSQK